MNPWWTWKVVKQDQGVRLDYDVESGAGEGHGIARNATAVALFGAVPPLLIFLQFPPWQLAALLLGFIVVLVLVCFIIAKLKIDNAADRARLHFKRTPTVMFVDADRLRFPPYDHAVPLGEIARVRIVKADSKGGEYERTPIQNVVYVEVYETGGSISRVPVAVFSTFEGAERPRKFLAQAAEVLRQFGPEVMS